MEMVLTREPLDVRGEEAEAEVQTERPKRSLREVLAALGIAPFRSKDVQKYLARMEWRATPLRTRLIYASVVTAAVLLALGVLTFLVSAISVIVSVFLAIVPSVSMAAFPIISCMTIGASLGWICFCMKQEITIAAWVTVLLGDYPRPLPAFVQQTATDLEEKYPEAEFFVEELQVGKRHFDPFLVVRDPQTDETYYVEVWNEPTFVRIRE